MKKILSVVLFIFSMYHVSAQVSSPVNYANLPSCTSYTLSYSTTVTMTNPMAQFFSGYDNSTSPIGAAFSVPSKSATFLAPNFPTGIYTLTVYDANNITNKMSTLVVITGQFPTVSAATNITITSFSFSCSGVSGSYLLYIATDPGFVNMLPAYNGMAVGQGSHIASTGINPNTQYWYRVKSVAGSCLSAYSSTATVTTLPLSQIVQPVGYANLNSCSTYTINYTTAVAMATPTAQFYSGYNNSTSPIGSPFSLVQNPGSYVVPNYTSGAYTLTIYDASNPSNRMSVIVIIVGVYIPQLDPPTIIGTGNFSLHWSGTSTTYQVQVATDVNFTNILSAYNNVSAPLPGEDPFTVSTGVNPCTQYWYRVRELSGSCVSAYSAPGTVITQPLAPSVTSLSNNTFNSSWTAATGADSYTVEWSTTSNFTSPGSQTISSNSLIVAVSGGQTYYVRYLVNYSDGTKTPYSLYSNSTTVCILTALSAPTATAATSITSTGFTANWTASTGADHYVVTIGSTNYPSTTSLSQSISSLSPFTTYTYTVTAYVCASASTASNALSVRTLMAAPVLEWGTNVTCEGFSVDLAWSSVAGAVSYVLYMDESPVETCNCFNSISGVMSFAESPEFKVAGVAADGTVGPLSNEGATGAIQPACCDKDVPGCGDRVGSEASTEIIPTEIPFSIYPNPVEYLVNISIPNDVDLKSAKIRVVNLMGTVISVPVIATGATMQLNVSTLPSGFYIVNLGSDKQQYTGKFIRK